MVDTTDSNIKFIYRFKFGDGKEKDFEINLDCKTLDLVCEQKKSYPPWTELNCEKCPSCSLDETKIKYCPIAISLVDVIDFFCKMFSYEEVDMYIETAQRDYMKHIPLQKAVSSLMGIYMVTGGCPILNKLRPMVRYHLPFATNAETTYRAIAMYLIAQYLLYKQGKDPDWDLKELGKIYEEINKVNASFCKRLMQINVEDATLNAIMCLDCFAQSVQFTLDQHDLDDITSLFKAYLE
jgi:hypothetical protein